MYERAIKEPIQALIGEINGDLGEFAPEYVRPAHKIAMRIFRDTRFSPDKRPYKTNVAAWWARQGFEKRSAAGYYLQIAPDGGFLAAAVYAPERDDLLTLRRWLGEHPERYRRVVRSLCAPKGKLPAMQPIEANALTRNPKGFPPDHPAGDLLRARNFGVTAPLSAEELVSPQLGSLVAAQFRRAVPLLALLNEPFLAAVAAQPAALGGL